MRCKVGDLAVSIKTHHRCNLGAIVRVIAAHDGKGDLRFPASKGKVWLVESARPLTWTCLAKRYRRKKGPVPDSQLQPIRAEPDDIKVSQAVKKLLRRIRQSRTVIEA